MMDAARANSNKSEYELFSIADKIVYRPENAKIVRVGNVMILCDKHNLPLYTRIR